MRVDRPAAVAVAAPLERAAEEDDVHLLLDGVADRPPEHGRAAGVEQVELRAAGVRAGDGPDDLGHDPSVAVERLERLAVLGVAQAMAADEVGVVVLDDHGIGGQIASGRCRRRRSRSRARRPSPTRCRRSSHTPVPARAACGSPARWPDGRTRRRGPAQVPGRGRPAIGTNPGGLRRSGPPRPGRRSAGSGSAGRRSFPCG